MGSLLLDGLYGKQSITVGRDKSKPHKKRTITGDLKPGRRVREADLYPIVDDSPGVLK
jgi:hypothetical protein